MKKLSIAIAALAMASVAMSANLKVALYQGTSPAYAEFDKEVMNALSAKTGDTYEFVPLENGKTPSEVLSDGVDIVTAVKKADYKGDKNLAFSVSYVSAELSVLLKKDKVKKAKELQNKVVCVCSKMEKEQAESYGASPLVLTDMQKKYEAFQENRCVGLIGTKVANNFFLKGDPNNKKLYAHKHKWLNFSNHYTLATTKDKKDVIKRLNRGLKAIKKDGTLDELLKKYFAPK